MKYIIYTIALCTLLFGADLPWSHDYEQMQEKARESKKLIYVFVTSDDCRWCRKFEETTLQSKEIQKRLYGEFEVVHISRDRHKVPTAFETSPVPRHYFTDEQGNIIYSSLGHRGEECFDSFMDNAQSKTKTTK
jgi:hypothetical protein